MLLEGLRRNQFARLRSRDDGLCECDVRIVIDASVDGAAACSS